MKLTLLLAHLLLVILSTCESPLTGSKSQRILDDDMAIYFVSPQEVFSSNEDFLQELKLRDGSSPEKAFFSIFTAISKGMEWYSEGTLLEEKSIQIFLTNGVHYLLECEAEVTLADDEIDYCLGSRIPNREYSYPFLTISISPYFCTNEVSDDYCTEKGFSEVFVQSPNITFNFSGSLSFESIDFNAINQLYLPQDATSENIAKARRQPIKYCEKPNYTDRVINANIWLSESSGYCLINSIGIQCDDFLQISEDYFEKKYSSTSWNYRRSFINLYPVDEHAPRLTLNNCIFQNFLRDYYELIRIEEDNISPNEEKHGSFGGKITITNTNFLFSRFCFGLIYYKFQKNYSSSEYSSGEYSLEVSNSVFSQLNVFNWRLRAKRVEVYPPFAENGIFEDYQHAILNLQGFNGEIYIHANIFNDNENYIPNWPQPRGPSDFDLTQYTEEEFNSQFSSLQDSPLSFGYKTWLLFDLVKNCSFDELESFGTIYISHHFKNIKISGNTFTRNFGVFGGAICINAFFSNSESSIFISNNTFNQNYAYLGGGAIFLNYRTQNDITEYSFAIMTGLFSNEFNENSVPTNSYGGAIYVEMTSISSDNYDYSYAISSVQSNTITIEDFSLSYYEIHIESCNFIDNMAGEGGSAIYFKSINAMNISGCLISGNRPFLWAFKDQNPYYLLYANDDKANPQGDYVETDEFLRDTYTETSSLDIYYGAICIINEETTQENYLGLYFYSDTFDGNYGIHANHTGSNSTSSLYISKAVYSTFYNCLFQNHAGVGQILTQYQSNLRMNRATSKIVTIETEDNKDIIIRFEKSTFTNNKFTVMKYQTSSTLYSTLVTTYFYTSGGYLIESTGEYFTFQMYIYSIQVFK